MSELDENAVEALKLTAAEGTVIRSWCQHDGFKIFKRSFEKKVERAHDQWLDETDPAKQESLRNRALMWREITNELKRLMLSGDNALRVLQEEQVNLNEASESK